MGVSKENKFRHMSPKIDKVIFSLFLNFSNNLNKTSHIIGIDFCAYLINIPWSHNYDDNYTFVIDIVFKYFIFILRKSPQRKITGNERILEFLQLMQKRQLFLRLKKSQIMKLISKNIWKLISI